MEVRRAYLESLVVAGTFLRGLALEQAWGSPDGGRSPGVAAIAGDLVSAIVATESCRQGSTPPDGVRRLTASEYFVVARPDPGRAPVGPPTADDAPADPGDRQALDAAFDTAVAALAAALPSERPDRAVTVGAGLPMLLDEYLVTRMVELAVGLDDLAVSLGVETPELPPVARACSAVCSRSAVTSTATPR